MGGDSSTFSACRHWCGASRERGFALVLTVILLAFVVLLLTALAAVTRVETQVAANHQQLAQARQNALFGLNVAIGQLQRYTGRDDRITAQACLLNEAAENPWFTGVWDAGASGPEAIAWLVSGNEAEPTRIGPETSLSRTAPEPEIGLELGPDGRAFNGPASSVPNRVKLVGAGSATATGAGLKHGAVVVPGVPIDQTPPGFNAPRTVGRYAFWVGDQGVKASLALPDRSAEVAYAPWDNARQRQRLRQQLSSGPAYFRNTAEARVGFDPLGPDNVGAIPRVVSDRQLQWLEPVAPITPLATTLRDEFHAFTATTFSVLANTRTDSTRGLMRDLSLAPAELGAAFAARADYTAYMEAPGAGNAALPAITSVDSPRRRYRISPPVASEPSEKLPSIEFGVAPVLIDFLLQFKVLRGGANRATIRSRLHVALWNPYTSAFIPPSDLSLEIDGLPAITLSSSSGTATVDLQDVSPTIGSESGAMRVTLPFDASAETGADRTSWLPGRLYGWVTDTGSAPPAALKFYNKNLNGTGWTYPAVALPGNDDALRVDCTTEAVLTVRLKEGGRLLATYVSPRYPDFVVPNVEQPSTIDNWVFGFGFRLKQPSATTRDRSWLISEGHDPRRRATLAEMMGPFDEMLGLGPEQYVDTPKTAKGLDGLLLLRTQGASLEAQSANNDVPLFELPRLPYLSLGEFQHLCLPERRPFALGNPWGGEANAIFDRFFLSGLSLAGAGPDIAKLQPLPNWNLHPVDTRALREVAWSLDSLRDGGNPLSSRFLLQAGGFNVNAARASAWRAVLSGRHFRPGQPFAYAAIDNGAGGKAGVYTGSQSGNGPSEQETVFNDRTLDDSTTDGTPGLSFSRFPQSAQETYAWFGDTAIASDLSKQSYRQGVRGGSYATPDLRQLTTADIVTLAGRIETLLRRRAAHRGPFRSMQEFLSPDSEFGGRSLLEAAIEDSGLNPPAIKPLPNVASFTDHGMSSLTLTQADLMVSLAPYLRTRSDTFVVRSFGEALNPATGQVAGRAWCEATVQRFPDPVDPADDIAQPAQSFGRRYKIVAFRWLSPAEI